MTKNDKKRDRCDDKRGDVLAIASGPALAVPKGSIRYTSSNAAFWCVGACVCIYVRACERA